MKQNIYTLYAIAFLQGMVFYGPVATLYRQMHGVNIFQITLIESVSYGLGILLEVPWGVIADRIGYRRTMIFCCGLYLISKIVFWQAESFAGFFIERILLSVVLAGISGVDYSILYLSCAGKDAQKVFGLYSSMSMAGLLLAGAIFSVFVRNQYALAGLLTVLSYGLALLLAFRLQEVKAPVSQGREKEDFRKTLREILGNRTIILFLAGAALLTETHQTITVFLNQMQFVRCGMADSAIGLVYILTTTLGLLGGYSLWVTRRVGMRGSFLLFCGLAGISCWILASVESAVPSVMGIFILRLVYTLFQPFAIRLQNQFITTRNRATVLSVYAMLMECVGIGTNLVFGALAYWNLSGAFFFGMGLCMLSWVLFFFWQKKHRSVQFSMDDVQ